MKCSGWVVVTSPFAFSSFKPPGLKSIFSGCIGQGSLGRWLRVGSALSALPHTPACCPTPYRPLKPLLKDSAVGFFPIEGISVDVSLGDAPTRRLVLVGIGFPPHQQGTELTAPSAVSGARILAVPRLGVQGCRQGAGCCSAPVSAALS